MLPASVLAQADIAQLKAGKAPLIPERKYTTVLDGDSDEEFYLGRFFGKLNIVSVKPSIVHGKSLGAIPGVIFVKPEEGGS